MNLSRACHRAIVLVALIEVLLVLVPHFAFSASSKSKKTAKKSSTKVSAFHYKGKRLLSLNTRRLICISCINLYYEDDLVIGDL